MGLVVINDSPDPGRRTPATPTAETPSQTEPTYGARVIQNLLGRGNDEECRETCDVRIEVPRTALID